MTLPPLYQFDPRMPPLHPAWRDVDVTIGALDPLGEDAIVGNVLRAPDGMHYVVVGAAPTRAEAARWARKVSEYNTPADFGWDLSPDAVRAAHRTVERWWQAIGKDNRVSSRASFAALKAEVPGYTLAAARDWWGSRGKNARQRLRAKYTKGYGDDFFSDIAKVATKAADLATLGPVARQIPGLKEAHGALATLQQLPLRGALEVARGGRIDRVALGQFKQAVGAARTLAPYVQTIVSVVPGLGTGLAAGLGAALALASGQPIDQAILAAVRSAVPGGALGQAAFDVTSGLVQGKPLDQLAINALPIAPAAKQALAVTAQAARALAEGKPVDQVILDRALAALPPEAQKAAQIATAVATAKNLQDAARKGAQTMIPQATQQIARQLPQLQRVAPQLQRWGAQAAPALAMVHRAKQGDQQAKAMIQRMAQAQQVNPQIARTMTLLRDAFAALQQLQVQGAVSGAFAGCGATGCATAGQWVTTADGQQVWVPADPSAPLRAETGGPVYDFLADVFKPRVGYRREQDTFTMRDAYRRGLGS